MPHAVLGPVIASVAGGLANKLFGGHGQTTAQLPHDMQGMRHNQISLLNYLTGFGPAPVNYAPMAQGGGRFSPVAGNTGQAPPPPNDPIGMARWAQQYGSPRAWQQAQQPHLAGGGMVQGPGGPTADQVPVMASDGEGMLNAGAIQAIGGPEVLHAINQLGIMHLLMQGHGMGQGSGMQGGTGNPQGQGMPHLAGGGMIGGVTLKSPWDWQGIKQGADALAQQRAQGMPTGGPGLAPTGNPTAATPPTIPQPASAPQGAFQMPGAQNFTPLKSDVQNRFESVYGQLGTPVTELQKQATGGLQQYLASDPLKQAQSSLNQILGDPGGAFRPDYERALAQAKQTGGRFGSANALMDSQALSNYNAQALQQAIGAAQAQGQLSGQNVANLTGGYNVGQQLAGQLNSGNQQTQQLLNQALQTAQGATFGAPTQQQPSAFGQFAQGAGSIAQLLPYLYPSQYGGGGGASVGAPAYNSPNYYG